MYSVDELISKLQSPTKQDIVLVKKGFEFSENSLKDQRRFSGDPYFLHVFETAKTLAELGMTATVVTAGLLHDCIEDAGVTPETIEAEFGKEIRFLVESVTKLGHVRYKGNERYNENLRKLFVAVSQDIRVIIIKLADRLHNIKTLQYVRPDKQTRIATETLEIYTPIAYRLGIRILSRQLENYAFPYVYPEEYNRVNSLVKNVTKENKGKMEKFHKSLRKSLAKYGYTTIHTEFREKSLYSLYHKLLRKDWDISKVYDILAIRVIAETVEDCYRILGIVHGVWRPLPGRIKDYIAFEKANGYKSIHTTVFTGDGAVVEIQIKTKDMHKEAEYGIASHISFKESHQKRWTGFQWIKTLLPQTSPIESDSGYSPSATKDVPQWIKEMVAYEDEHKEFSKSVTSDFLRERMLIFTPQGDVIDLPVDSTPIDFAYAIHSDIGNRIVGATVDGKFVSLNTKLHNGDTVEIQTKDNATPNPKWIEYAKTALAQRHIRIATNIQLPGSKRQRIHKTRRRPARLHHAIKPKTK